MKRYGLNRNAVIGRWSIGYEAGTSVAPVPGGRRLEAIKDPGVGDLLLYSYRTLVAARRQEIAPDGLSETIVYALTPRKYSRSTSALMSEIRRLLTARGYVKTDEVQHVSAAVPGRWGGYGPAWHATGVETLPFEVWKPFGERFGREAELAAARTRSMEAVDGTYDIRDRPHGERDGLPTGAR